MYGSNMDISTEAERVLDCQFCHDTGDIGATVWSSHGNNQRDGGGDSGDLYNRNVSGVRMDRCSKVNLFGMGASSKTNHLINNL